MGVYIGVIPNLIPSDMQGPCPTGFHIPSIQEWTELITKMKALGINIYRHYQNYIRLPFIYYRNYTTGGVNSSLGAYWSSSPSTTSTSSAYAFRMATSSATSEPGRYSAYQAYGYYIRPFKDTPAIPDSSRTEVFSNSEGSIYEDSTNGLISISYKGQNWLTLANKNLGATIVYNAGDTYSESNCGNFFQWGNNYGFPRSGTVTTSSTRVDATGYGPGNYYSSSTFIRNYSMWTRNPVLNLRGGVTGAKPSPLTVGKFGTTGISNIYVGDLKVRPEGSSNRTPSNHTKAYRPLNSTTTVNDQSGNGYNLTQTGGSFGTYNGVDCFYNGGASSGYFRLTSGSNIPSGGDSRTISFWIYPTNYSSSYSCGFFRCGKTGSSNYSHYRLVVNFGGVPVAVRCQNGQDSIIGTSISTSGWSLITVVLTPLRYQLYINGQLMGSSTSYVDTPVISNADPFMIMNGSSTGTINGNYQTHGYINEFIIEDIPWSPDKILAYYNQTKTAHGIS